MLCPGDGRSDPYPQVPHCQEREHIKHGTSPPQSCLPDLLISWERACGSSWAARPSMSQADCQTWLSLSGSASRSGLRGLLASTQKTLFTALRELSMQSPPFIHCLHLGRDSCVLRKLRKATCWDREICPKAAGLSSISLPCSHPRNGLVCLMCPRPCVRRLRSGNKAKACSSRADIPTTL